MEAWNYMDTVENDRDTARNFTASNLKFVFDMKRN